MQKSIRRVLYGMQRTQGGTERERERDGGGGWGRGRNIPSADVFDVRTINKAVKEASENK